MKFVKQWVLFSIYTVHGRVSSWEFCHRNNESSGFAQSIWHFRNIVSSFTTYSFTNSFFVTLFHSFPHQFLQKVLKKKANNCLLESETRVNFWQLKKISSLKNSTAVWEVKCFPHYVMWVVWAHQIFHQIQLHYPYTCPTWVVCQPIVFCHL